MKIYYILFIAAIMTSCAGGERTPIEVETATYVVTDFDPPKHVAVDLKRVSDGRTFHITFGKHCNGYRERLYVGRQVSINRTPIQMGKLIILNLMMKNLETVFVINYGYFKLGNKNVIWNTIVNTNGVGDTWIFDVCFG